LSTLLAFSLIENLRERASMAVSLGQALSALFSLDSEAQQQANSWIQTFAAKPEAWNAALTLIDSHQAPEVSFFCANLLLSKTRSEWLQLQHAERHQLQEAFRLD
jgi:hypothetical protein